MMTKTIKITDKIHEELNRLASKDQTYSDVINQLITYYEENEEFTDEQADYYNKRIEQIEKGDMTGTTEIRLSTLEKEIEELRKEIKQ